MMEERERTLELTMTGTKEERDDRWAFTCSELGFTVYGLTEAAAEQALADAVTVLLNSFGGDDSLLRNYLDKKGVKHRFVLSTDRPQVQGWQRNFEVALPAAD